jgi:hypothetical protein
MKKILSTFFALSLFSCGDGLPSDPADDYSSFLITELNNYKEKAQGFSYRDDYQFDVKKTDSLVSPLMGTCHVSVFAFQEVKEDIFEISFASGAEVTFNHAYQKGKWVLTQGVGRLTGYKILSHKSLSQHLSDDDCKDIFEKTARTFKGTSFNFDNLEGLKNNLVLQTSNPG